MGMIKFWQNIYLNSKHHIAPHTRSSMLKLKDKNLAIIRQQIQIKEANNTAQVQLFINGFQSFENKNITFPVPAVRPF